MCFFIFWFGVLFLISWPVHGLWMRWKNKPYEQNFYYEKSYWITFLIVLITFLIVDLLVTIILIKVRQ